MKYFKLAMLKNINQYIAEDKIFSKEIIRYSYSSDASYYRYIPDTVIFPENIEDIRNLFRYCKNNKKYLTFRAAGTSLSGQSQTDGILVNILKYWKNFEIIENGDCVKTQPGVIAGKINVSLVKYGRKIGPDPASINACSVGGIAANNSSGMSSGIVKNPYHTVKSISFILPEGTYIDSSQNEADEILKRKCPQIYNGLLEIRNKIFSSPSLKEKIIEKYKIKNTTGYSLNSFLDYEKPADILTHLMIGSEGTLGFISEIVFKTFPLKKEKLTGLLFFRDIKAAADSLPFLKSMDASALELMDYNCLLSIKNNQSVPNVISNLQKDTAALLFEYEDDEISELFFKKDRITDFVKKSDLSAPPLFSEDLREREVIWNVRRGLLTSLSSSRNPETSVIIEDIAFAVEDLADALNDLQNLLKKHDFNKTGIFGHGLDGNVHFMLSQSFKNTSAIDSYDAFMHELADLVIDKYNGSLKAEHGTGRNMAPFLKKEWGSEVLQIMKDIKELIDPDCILNPDVIISDDPNVHLNNIKTMPQVNEIIDNCIECGFCEPVCPSRDYTLTPRMRIAVSRILKDNNIPQEIKKNIEKDYMFYSVSTCAVDGLCEMRCPVGINTGSFIKSEREKKSSGKIQEHIAGSLPIYEVILSIFINVLKLKESVIGEKGLNFFIKTLENVSSSTLPKWNSNISLPSKLIFTAVKNAEYVYFPCCTSRIMGKEKDGNKKYDIIDAFKTISHIAGVNLFIPKDIRGSCCGMAFSSKGYSGAYISVLSKTLIKLYKWSAEGSIPIVFDSSSCAYSIKNCRNDLNDKMKDIYDRLTFFDSIEFFHKIRGRLPIKKKKKSVVLHPNCSVVKMGLIQLMIEVAEICSDDVIVPENLGCCGFAGDRGLLYPDLTASALKEEMQEVNSFTGDAYYSSNIPCNIGLNTFSTNKYLHLAHLIKECID